MEVKGFYCVSCKQRWICRVYAELLDIIEKIEDIAHTYSACLKFNRLSLEIVCPFRTEEL